MNRAVSALIIYYPNNRRRKGAFGRLYNVQFIIRWWATGELTGDQQARAGALEHLLMTRVSPALAMRGFFQALYFSFA